MPKVKTSAGRKPVKASLRAPVTDEAKRRKVTLSKVFDECELQLIAKANTRLNGKVRERFNLFRKATTVSYLFENNFTKCVITTPKSVHVGVAKRNPTDRVNHAAAQNIAFYRAITEAPVVL